MTLALRMVLGAAAAALIALVALLAAAIASQRGTGRALAKGRFAPCAPAPNSVSSRASDAAHHVEPIALPAGVAEPEEALARLVAGWPGARVTAREPGYLRAEISTPLLHFVDDLELEIDARARVAHVRSASRVGHSDLGANRRRVEALRAAVAALGAPGAVTPSSSIERTETR